MSKGLIRRSVVLVVLCGSTSLHAACTTTDAGTACGPTKEAGSACQPDTYCQDASGKTVPGCGSACGGIGFMPCPSSDLVCLETHPSGSNDGPIDTCVPPAVTTCTVDADCACIPGDCSYWDFSSPGTFRWACEGCQCVAHCD